MNAPDTRATLPILAMVIFYVLASAVFAVLPLLVGATVELLGFTAKQAGLIGGADMFGGTVSALCVSFIVPRGKWRLLIISGILILTAADAYSGLAQTFPSLLMSRIVAGLGEGLVLTIATVSIAETRNPDRVYAFAAAGLVAFGSPALYLMPSLLAAHGLRGVFWLLAALTAITTPLVRCVPDLPHLSEPSAAPLAMVRIPRKSIIGLAGVFMYFIAQGGVWAFLDRIGLAHHIETSSVGIALAVSAIAGFLGALLASWLDVRYGRLKPLLCSTVGTVVALLTLNEIGTLAVFTAMTALFNFSWNVAVPYQFGALAEVDSSRRTVALAGVFVNAGLAAGPVIAAALISEQSVQNVSWMGIAFSGLSFLLFGRILMRMERIAAVRCGAT
jgi:MFS transporter, DHA1 family, inner membrane transport protein